ncbi:MAG: DUF3488 domain-containing protein [Pseudomonadales bacterium]|nr:DUF3488 domain-containing protein [Pseudomonadales bacterium]
MSARSYQIPRDSLIWLLTAQVAVVLPHIERLPPWITFVSALCVFWRVMVYQGRWSYPGKQVRLLLVVTGVVGVVWSYGTLLGTAQGVSLLILTYSLKLLEMNTQKDAYVSVVLSYFVVATEFLFSQSIPIAFYMIFVLIMITAALVGMNQSYGEHKPTRTIKLACGILLQALPLMIIIFVFFPRIPPLWSLDLSGHKARIGLSETMTPGSIAELGNSSELAFRAQFRKGEVPELHDLYWRGLVYSHFDGNTWAPGVATPGDLIAAEGNVRNTNGYRLLQNKNDPVSYTITLEPTDQIWLFGLEMPVSFKNEVGFTSDFRLVKNTPISQIYQYDLTSYLDYVAEPKLTGWMRDRELQLPPGTNPKSVALAKKWMKQESHQAERYVGRVLNWFHEEEFFYTLKPPLLNDEIVDRFLFESRRGFCAHYAGAFVFMMRAVGIPARVVAGYQGGEINPLGRYVLVHQFDAHAWTEVWLGPKGWVRVDPTAAVAPERIEKGLEESLQDGGEFLQNEFFSVMKYRRNPLVNNLRLSIDYLNHNWNKFIIGYNSDLQLQFLQRFLGKVSPQKMAIVMMSLLGVCLGVLALWMLTTRTKRTQETVNRAYYQLLSFIESSGLIREKGETPQVFSNRVVAELPELTELIERLTAKYNHLKYYPLEGHEKEILVKDFQNEVRNARFAFMKTKMNVTLNRN